MADYLTHFSCLLDVGTSDNVVRALALYADTPADEDGMSFPNGFAAETAPDADTSLWLRDAGFGDVEQLIRFALLCAERLDLTGRWGFEYALTCSRPLLDGFGGGAHVVDLGARASLDWTSTSDWLANTIAGGETDA